MAHVVEKQPEAAINSREELSVPMSSWDTAFADFMQQGYALLPNALDKKLCVQLRGIIDSKPTSRKLQKRNSHNVLRRVFEEHPGICLDVFRNHPVLQLVQRLLSCCGSARGDQVPELAAHVIHNNAFRVDRGMRGQAPTWHTDDPPTFLTDDGGPLPDSVTIAPLVLTCMYFLNDLETPGDGGTRVIEGSHRFGSVCSNESAAHHPHRYVACPAGSVLILSSQTWHRGSAVAADGSPRYVFQVTYGRRLVGHKHGTIMNYKLPQAVEEHLHTDEDRKLLGFLQGGAYS